MSSTSPENERNDHLQASTPSQETRETPGWVRILGFIGIVCFGAGVLMYAYNARVYLTVLKGPEYVTGVSLDKNPFLFNYVTLFFLVGVVGMLIQASRERDSQQRRYLGIIGIILFALGVLFLTNVLVSEGVRHWLSPAASDPNQEKAVSQGRWAGLVATIAMAVVLLVAWVAPFVRAVSEGRVSIFALPGKWLTKMGEGRVSVATLIGAVVLITLAVLTFFLKEPLVSYCTAVLKFQPENVIAYGLSGYAYLFILIGMPFLLIFARTEEDQAWSKVPSSLFGAVGVVASVFGLVGVVADLLKVPDYTLPYGFGLALLGLLCLGFYVGHRGSDSESGYATSKWMAWAGMSVLTIAAVRSLLPALVEMNWLQEAFTSLEEISLSSYLVPSGFLYMVLGAAFAILGWTLASENKLLVLTRKELGAFFTSPIGYVVLGGTVVAAWVSFWVWLSDLSDPQSMMGTPEPVVFRYFFGIFPVIFMVVAVPMLTMRLVSEEHRTGTMEVLLTAPVGEVSIIISKFLATWIFYLVCWVVWLIFPLVLRVAGEESFDYRPLLSVMLGLGAMGFGFIGMGLFFSSLTKNQIVAFLLAFAGMFAWIMVYFVQFFIASSTGMRTETTTTWVEVIKYVSFIDHLGAFSRGSLFFKNVLFHVSLGLFWLFLTVKVLESRKWR